MELYYVSKTPTQLIFMTIYHVTILLFFILHDILEFYIHSAKQIPKNHNPIHISFIHSFICIFVFTFILASSSFHFGFMHIELKITTNSLNILELCITLCHCQVKIQHDTAKQFFVLKCLYCTNQNRH